MEKSALPIINPPTPERPQAPMWVGVLEEPADHLGRVTEALVDGAVRLSEISVFGRQRALEALDPEYRPQASRIVHLFDVRDRELRRYKRALEANEAIITVRVETYERHQVAEIMKRNGVSDIAFYSRRHHRRPADDLGTSGNAALTKRRRLTI